MPRLEKQPRVLDEAGYTRLLALLREAEQAHADYRIRILPEPGETLNTLARQFKWAAKRAGIAVIVRRHLQDGHLTLWFARPSKRSKRPKSSKRSARETVLAAVTAEPLSLAELQSRTGVSASRLRRRLRTLESEGRIACLDDGTALHIRLVTD